MRITYLAFAFMDVNGVSLLCFTSGSCLFVPSFLFLLKMDSAREGVGVGGV